MAATSTRERNSEIEALEAEITELMREVDRYRTACEDTMQQLDWCIGYFTGCNKRGLAKSLAANRSAIRRRILKRDEQAMPTNNKES
ncbi:hypothetical protein ACVW00_004225 [Marmoricola sp. URHA0025 HA25]